MKKKDLKTGMIVEHEDGHLGVMIGGTSISCNGGGISMNYLKDDLSHGTFGIIKVYSKPDKTKNYNASMDFWLGVDKEILKYCKLLWERKKYKVGDWLKIKNLIDGCTGSVGVGVYTEEPSDSGLLRFDVGINIKQLNGEVWRVNGDITQITDKEVEEALIKEAKKRGFKEGVKVDLRPAGHGTFNRTINNNTFRYSAIKNWLCIDDLIIFDTGKWAAIEEEKSVLELDGVKYSESTLRSLIKKATS